MIGSDLGGIAELVTSHDRDGLLVSQYASSDACEDRGFSENLRPTFFARDRWRENIRPPRHAKQVALDFMPIYREVMAEQLVGR